MTLAAGRAPKTLHVSKTLLPCTTWLLTPVNCKPVGVTETHKNHI